MAKIQEELIVVRLSKLVKDSDAGNTALASAEITANLEAVVQQLVGNDVIVEVIKE